MRVSVLALTFHGLREGRGSCIKVSAGQAFLWAALTLTCAEGSLVTNVKKENVSLHMTAA